MISPELAERSPVYAELRNLIDLSIAAAYIQQQDYCHQAGWKMELFGSEQAFPIRKPTTFPRRSNRPSTPSGRTTRWALQSVAACKSQAAEAINLRNLLSDEKGKVQQAPRIDQARVGQGPVVVGLRIGEGIAVADPRRKIIADAKWLHPAWGYCTTPGTEWNGRFDRHFSSRWGRHSCLPAGALAVGHQVGRFPNLWSAAIHRRFP